MLVLLGQSGQLFANAPEIVPAYEWLTPACQQYVSDNIWQVRVVYDYDDTHPQRYHAVAYTTAQTVYFSGQFVQTYSALGDAGTEWIAFVLVHEAAHAEDWRLYREYRRPEVQADAKAWECYQAKKYGW